jgi:esterase/lipase superfamily enzyme
MMKDPTATPNLPAARKVVAPVGHAFLLNETMGKLIWQISLLSFGYMLLAILLELAAQTIPVAFRILLAILPALGLIAFAYLKKKKITVEIRKLETDLAAAIARSMRSVIVGGSTSGSLLTRLPPTQEAPTATAEPSAESAPPQAVDPGADIGLGSTQVGKSISLERNDPPYAIVKIFYATDRKPIAENVPSFVYGNEHSLDGMLSLGTCEVSIPRDHRLGQLEHASVWRLEFRGDPENALLLRITLEEESSFWVKLIGKVAESRHREAFVFVHGYNTTFEDAARRTAQLSYDLGFDGAPICYSWPSYSKFDDYRKDEDNAQWTIPHLKNFLRALATQSQATTVHVIGHSMGNRAVSYALQMLSADANKHCRMHNVVLTAPDIDADAFKELAKDLKSVADTVTLYISPADRALAMSKRFHGNPRLGEIFSIIPGIDTIDASDVDTTFTGHSYHAENRSVLSDIFWLFKDGKPPRDRFGMRPVEHRDGTYYEFQPRASRDGATLRP